MKNREIFLSAYDRARVVIEGILGKKPDNYKILMFIDPALYDSILIQTEQTGSPKAVVSSNQLYILKEMQEEGFIARGKDLFYASRSPRIFYPIDLMKNDPNGKVIEAKLVQAFAKSILCEETISRFPDTLQKLYRLDTIIYDLFANNVYEFVLERGASWIWKYFQDFTSVIRLLSLYELDDFYVPPTSIRNASIFYNYLMEIKNIIRERAKTVVKAPLYDLVINGFGNLVLNEYLTNFDKNVTDNLIPHLKSNLGQPLGVIGALFLRQYGENINEIFDATLQFKNDQELTSIWNRGKTKEGLSLIRDELSKKSMVWHQAKDSYWSDLWPMRASQFDKISNYIGKIQRRGFKSFLELQNDSPLIIDHGRVQLKDREVAIFGIQEDTVGQEQLIILRNHLQAKKETFSTPLPGLPDTIVFKKYSGMHIASYLGVVETKRNSNYPKSPYDLPVVVRAIQVTSKKGAYISDERKEDGKIDEANYEELQGMTEPQHRAIRYLIRQRDVVQ